jgi:autotransporter-associated beta strand protein
LSVSNSFSGGTVIQGGDIILANDTANQSGLGSGAVTLSGGMLNMFNAASNAVSWNLIVPVATTGRLNAAPACDLYGSLTGSGTFNLFIPAQQTAFYGDWSAFGGQINIFTTTNGDFRLANFSGLSNAVVNLSNNVAAYFTVDPGTDTTIDIGALSGDGASRLLGITGDSTLTLRVGGRNTDAIFAGTIAEQDTNTTTDIQKIGSGIWTLSGSNSYAGDTLVSAGTLLVNNSAGSGTGYGNLTIAGGATLGGNGIIGSDTTVSDGATLAPGNPTGTLTISNNLTLNDNSILQFTLGTNGDSVVVSGNLLLTGQLTVTNSGGFGTGTYMLFTYGGTLTFGQLVLASAPPGYNYSFDTNSPGIVNLVVAPPAPPSFSNSVSVVDGGLVFSGGGGTPLADYYVLASTNVALPLADWTRIATNQFDSSGNFIITNSIDTNAPQNYYLLQIP